MQKDARLGAGSLVDNWEPVNSEMMNLPRREEVWKNARIPQRLLPKELNSGTKRRKRSYWQAEPSRRPANALLRNAALVVGEYRVGDMTSFQRSPAARGVRRNRWSPAARVIRFMGALPTVCWVVCEGIPFCISVDPMRSASAESLAVQYLHE